MIHPRAASSADRVDDRFCERCGNPAGPMTTLTRAGLTTCRACGIHVCARCWARSAGSCPACGVSIAATPLAVATPGHRSARGRAPALAAAGGALLLTATVFAFAFVAPLRPTAGVAGATGTPRTSGLDAVGFAPPTVSKGAVGTDPSATDRTGTGSGGTAGPGTTKPPPGGGTPPPETTPGPHVPPPVPTPTPEPTAVPPPPPTPDPTPTPEPTAPPTPTASQCVATAPNLLGQNRSDAHRLWTAAGFTGAVTALDGHGNFAIASQDRTPGAVFPCDTGVTIGP